MNTSNKEMRKNIAKYKAKELYYYQWSSGEPYTVDASDGEEHGKVKTIGHTDNPESLKEFGLPVFNHCPFN